jgi:hypothetical protein
MRVRSYAIRATWDCPTHIRICTGFHKCCVYYRGKYVITSVARAMMVNLLHVRSWLLTMHTDAIYRKGVNATCYPPDLIVVAVKQPV